MARIVKRINDSGVEVDDFISIANTEALFNLSKGRYFKALTLVGTGSSSYPPILIDPTSISGDPALYDTATQRCKADKQGIYIFGVNNSTSSSASSYNSVNVYVGSTTTIRRSYSTPLDGVSGQYTGNITRAVWMEAGDTVAFGSYSGTVSAGREILFFPHETLLPIIAGQGLVVSGTEPDEIYIDPITGKMRLNPRPFFKCNGTVSVPSGSTVAFTLTSKIGHVEWAPANVITLPWAGIWIVSMRTALSSVGTGFIKNQFAGMDNLTYYNTGAGGQILSQDVRYYNAGAINSSFYNGVGATQSATCDIYIAYMGKDDR
jgi:hypothetical protein